MKNKFNVWLLMAALLCSFSLTSCGDPDEDEDDIYVNINGGNDSNGDDGKGDDSEQNIVSIVGSWQRECFDEGGLYKRITLNFSSDHTGSCITYYPGWETRGLQITNYDFNMDNCVLKVTFVGGDEGEYETSTYTAFIVDDVLHTSFGDEAMVPYVRVK